MMKIFVVHIFVGMMYSAALMMAGCDKEKNSTSMYEVPMLPATGKKYLALGDSYTIGQGVQPEERFPHLAVALLRQQNIALQQPHYIAATGWTTIDLLQAINQQQPANDFDVVTLLIGVNDQYQHLDTAGYRERFSQLLNKAVTLAGNNSKKVIVLSIPDYSVTPFVTEAVKQKVRKEIDAFNDINRQITLQNHINYLDITTLTREAAIDLSLLTTDDLHYSAKEYTQWAQLLVPVIKTVLQ